MLIKMDTDNVRAMSSKLRQTADSMDSSLASINHAVTSAGWESQAREEFIMHLEMVRRGSMQSTEVLRMMAQAADEKANQWEAIGSVFNGPFYYLRNIWDSIMNFVGGLWGGVKSAINSLRMPSLPVFIFPPIGKFIVDFFRNNWPDWKDWKLPIWWRKLKESEKNSSTNKEEGEEKSKESETSGGGLSIDEKENMDTPAPVEPIGLDQDDPRWGNEVMGDNGKTIDQAGCLITSIAMIARINGADVTPSDVNNYMKSHNGYVENTSNMKLDSAKEFLESVLGKDFSYSWVGNSQVNERINSGYPVLIHVKGNTADGHWVLATGVDSAGNYVVYESSTGKQSTYPPSQLHEKNNNIVYI